MDQTANMRATVPSALRSLYAPVARDIDRVEELLRRELSNDNAFVDQLVKHGFRLGGKRLRPALVLLSASACGEVRSEHDTLAAMVELFHTASLVHDDVLDEATLRRHLDTVNARWDNEASILLGDFLFARAICMASSVDDPYASRVVSQSASSTCEGELRQVASRGNYDLTEADYLQIVAGKTAALMSCCCRLGAHYAGATPEICDQLARYGHDLGVAFQIADDVLDLLGDEATVGKSLGTDLLKQKATLPLIRLLQTIGSSERTELIGILSNSDEHHRVTLRPWLDRSDAIGYAQDKARRFTRQAAAELASLPPTPAKDSLLGLTEFVIQRRQ
jgi:octaprenyl-diphosphate synthase